MKIKQKVQDKNTCTIGRESSVTNMVMRYTGYYRINLGLTTRVMCVYRYLLFHALCYVISNVLRIYIGKVLMILQVVSPPSGM